MGPLHWSLDGSRESKVVREGLERWIGSQQHCVLFQKSGVQFPVHARLITIYL